jgi:hypothetical protein
MKVYRSHFASKVHFDPVCPSWKASTASHPLEEWDLADLKAVKFCLVCTPPELHQRPRTHHVQCVECNYRRPMPCEHNGGVAVVNVDDMVHYGRPERRVNIRWRWPENVQGAPLADPGLLV